ncbi:hypothetical protein BHE74_00057915 [Ensete ventricosum]|nr:hypothetical protein BHE74_00057915 [Ensete ventricosum]
MWLRGPFLARSQVEVGGGLMPAWCDGCCKIWVGELHHILTAVEIDSIGHGCGRCNLLGVTNEGWSGYQEQRLEAMPMLAMVTGCDHSTGCDRGGRWQHGAPRERVATTVEEEEGMALVRAVAEEGDGSVGLRR